MHVYSQKSLTICCIYYTTVIVLTSLDPGDDDSDDRNVMRQCYIMYMTYTNCTAPCEIITVWILLSFIFTKENLERSLKRKKPHSSYANVPLLWGLFYIPCDKRKCLINTLKKENCRPICSVPGKVPTDEHDLWMECRHLISQFSLFLLFLFCGYWK